MGNSNYNEHLFSFQLASVLDSQEVIEKIALLKDKKYAEFPLLCRKWRTLKELSYILKIPYDATISLQKRNLTLSDTYRHWIEMKLHLQQVIATKKSKTKLDVSLMQKLDNRHDDIFDHPAMKAALYLDPRFRNTITRSEENENDAKEFLISLHKRLHCFKSQNSDEPIEVSTVANDLSGDSDDSFGITFDPQAAFNEFLGHTNQTGLGSLQNEHWIDDFEQLLNDFDPDVIPIKNSVIEFWLNQPANDLRDIALALYAIPPTETEVERDFSALKFIFSDLRSGLLDETLEDILCIHLNKNMYLAVNDKKIQELKKSL